MHVVQLAVGNMDEARNVALQVEQRMHLHSGLGGAEVRPRKGRQAQVDGRRVQCIDSVRQFQAQVLAGIQCPGLTDQPLRKVGMDAPVARLVGVGQRRAPNRLAKSHVVQLGLLSRQAHLDVSQALAVGQLGEGHDPKLLRARQCTNALVAIVARDVPGECRPGQEIHELGEQRLACVHGSLRAKARKTARIGIRRSNRHHPSSLGIPWHAWLTAIYPSI